MPRKRLESNLPKMLTFTTEQWDVGSSFFFSNTFVLLKLDQKYESLLQWETRERKVTRKSKEVWQTSRRLPLVKIAYVLPVKMKTIKITEAYDYLFPKGLRELPFAQ